MTREEAVERFQRMKKIFSIPNSDAERTIEAIDMAIESLSAPSGDLISRQWLLDLYETPKDGDGVDWKVPLEVVRQNIKDAPSAEAVSHNDTVTLNDPISIQADRSKEAWIRKEEKLDNWGEYCAFYWYECSACGAKPPKNQWGNNWHSNFCPNCGAIMYKGGDD